MSEVRVINVNVGVFEENNRIADQVRELNKESGTFLVNIMASPGAGKTSVLLRTIAALKDAYRIGVMEADIDATVDAEKMKQAGVLNVEILSVPEGDDKPLKYPLMFQVCQCILVNKTDTRKFFAFDDAAFVQRIHDLNPDAKIIFLSAKTGEGFEEWISWLKEQIERPGTKSGGKE